MAKKISPNQELLELSPAEIDHLSSGCYSDYDIMTAVEKLSDLEDQTQTAAKRLALLKLIWRSPEIDDWFAYEKILYELLDAVIEVENGKDFLTWALTAVIFFAHHHRGLLTFDTYWNYARGFLYQGHGALFGRFLDYALVKTALPEYALRLLIEDAARLGAENLAHQLQTMAEKRYLEAWQAVPIDEIMAQGKDLQAPTLINDDQTKAILDRLQLENLAEHDEDIEMRLLISSDEIQKKLSENLDPEDFILMVPDIIQILFLSWEDERGSCGMLLKLLKILENILPELRCLGDLLNEDPKEVFIFADFGKTAGFTFDSLKKYTTNPEYNNNLRMSAARAIMQIPSKAPRYRSQALEVIKHLLNTPHSDPFQDDQMTSFIVADVLDTDLYELKPAISQVFQENRVDPLVVGLESYTGFWSLDEPVDSAPNREKSILLECQKCGRTRYHPFDMVFYDISMRDRKLTFTPLEVFLDHPIFCPVCGVKDSYTVSFTSMLQLVPPDFFDDDDADFTILDESVYLLFSEHLFMDGLSPFIFSTLRKKVIDGGLDSLDALERGEYTRVTGKFQESLQALRQFVSENPKSQIGALALAMAEHDFGDRHRAAEYYQRTLAIGKNTNLSQKENPRNKVAQHGLEALRKGERSPYLYPANKFGKTLLDRHPKKDRKHKQH